MTQKSHEIHLSTNWSIASTTTDVRRLTTGICSEKCVVRDLVVVRMCTYTNLDSTRVGTLMVATIYLQLIQNRYMFRSFTVLQCSHQHCVQPVASDVEVVGYL